jgi:hypothetical protein
MTLKPSASRVAFLPVAIVLAVATVDSATRLWLSGDWPSPSYYWSTAAMTIIWPILLGAMAVPRRISLDERSLSVVWPFCGKTIASIDDVEKFGQTVGLFQIQVRGALPIRIFALAFRPRQWEAFVKELNTQLPGRSSSSMPV